jgi:hypothetical protein
MSRLGIVETCHAAEITIQDYKPKPLAETQMHRTASFGVTDSNVVRYFEECKRVSAAARPEDDGSTHRIAGLQLAQSAADQDPRL